MIYVIPFLNNQLINEKKYTYIFHQTFLFLERKIYESIDISNFFNTNRGVFMGRMTAYSCVET